MPSRPVPAAPDAAAERLRCRLMADALGQLLDRVPGSREVLLHVASLERSLRKQGLQGIALASERTLQRICTQLGSLPQVDDDPALHDLLDRLGQALELRRAERHDDLPFDIERTVVIEEVSHSVFQAAERDLLTTLREPRL